MSGMPPAAYFAARGKSECVHIIFVPAHRFTTAFVAQGAMGTVFSRKGCSHSTGIWNRRDSCSSGLLSHALTETVRDLTLSSI